MLTFNEGKVCEAILRCLEMREGRTRSEVRSPEAEGDPDPVELVWKLGTRLFALEHTGIEPFADHVRLQVESKRHFDPIRAALKDLLPTEIIELHVPVRAMLGRNKVEVGLVQAAIIAWVRRIAPTLNARTYADFIGDVSWSSVPGVPFEVKLFRFVNLAAQPGYVQIVHSVDGDRRQQRDDRLRRACDKKFPKLAAWKQKRGARTVLVLEENDIQLTNYAIVAETYLPLALGRADRPDETYLVSTCIEQEWSAWPLLIDDQTIHDLVDTDGYVRRWHIDPAGLASATAR